MYGKRMRKAALLLAAVFLTGCGSGVDRAGAGKSEEESVIRENGENSENGEISESLKEEEETGVSGGMEAQQEPADEVWDSVPNICVNLLGYTTKSDKIAIVYGEELPQEFHVVRADSEEVVFAGYLRDKGYNEAQQEYNGYGDFSEVEESGTYYIEAPLLGRSCTFRIGDDLYKDVLKDACRSYDWRMSGAEQDGGQEEGARAKRFPEAAGDMALMLLAYELNPGVFTDDAGISESGNGVPDILDEIRYKAEQMLQMQDKETGAVSADTAGGGQWEEAYAMALAKFSYLYQNYDTDFATECLIAADKAWTYADFREEEEAEASKKNEWKLSAAAELYRASGRESFHEYISEYFLEYGYAGEPELPVLLGYVAYISTRQPVELAFCEEITRVLTVCADEAAERTEDFLLENQEGGIGTNCRKMLEDSMYLILMNHMITSREYEVVAENILHYLMGRNAESVSCIEDVKENDCRLILLLSEVINWQKEHESGE